MANEMTWRTRLWVIGGAVVVGVIVLTAEHNDSRVVSGPQPSQSSCRMTVTETLNVRSGPGTENDLVQTLATGAEVPADRDRVTRNGYRQLGPNRWALEQYLTPTPGSNCG